MFFVPLYIMCLFPFSTYKIFLFIIDIEQFDCWVPWCNFIHISWARYPLTDMWVCSSYQSWKILSLFFKCFFCPHTTSENLIAYMLGHWKLPNNSMLFSFFILGVFIYMPSSFPTMSNLLLILSSICFISDIIVFNYQSFIWVFVVLPCLNFVIYEIQI